MGAGRNVSRKFCKCATTAKDPGLRRQEKGSCRIVLNPERRMQTPLLLDERSPIEAVDDVLEVSFHRRTGGHNLLSSNGVKNLLMLGISAIQKVDEVFLA